MKKKTILIISVLFSLVFLLCACSGDNKKDEFAIGFKDGEFKSAESFSAWDQKWETEGTSHEWVSESRTDDGTGCLKISHPNNSATSSHISQDITLVKNAKYKLSGYVKLVDIVSKTANGNGGAYCTLGDALLGKCTKQDVSYTSDDWEYFETFYTATATDTYRFSCKIWGANGTAYFDDLNVQLVEKTDSEVLKHWAQDGSVTVPSGGFSLAAVGDPQIVISQDVSKSTSVYCDSMKNILDMSKDWNIQYVMDLGDLTDSSSDTSQWIISKEGHKILDEAGLKYSLSLGNHDYDGLVGLKGGVVVPKKASRFCANYKLDKYKELYGTENFGAFDDTMMNTFHKFSADGYDYMIIALEFAPSYDTVAWAKDLCDSNPDRNVIITTHALFRPRDNVYLYDTQTEHLKDVANSTYMWKNLISKCPNIFLTCCGHCDCHGTAAAITYGNAGNKITNICCDPQGTLGGAEMMTAILHIENGTDVTCYAYSPSVRSFYAGSNYKIDLLTDMGTLNGDTLTVNCGASGKIFTHEILDGAVVTYEYKSSKEKVATVSEDGTVTAVAPGKATITCLINTAQSAYAENGPGARIRVEVNIEVK